MFFSSMLLAASLATAVIMVAFTAVFLMLQFVIFAFFSATLAVFYGVLAWVLFRNQWRRG